jgi:tRNA U34 2-thiouridine synthase MnmA/TrmU
VVKEEAEEAMVEAAAAARYYVLRVRFDVPARAVTPKQALVLYDGDTCLGGGLGRLPGRSHFERGLQLPAECVA